MADSSSQMNAGAFSAFIVANGELCRSRGRNSLEPVSFPGEKQGSLDGPRIDARFRLPGCLGKSGHLSKSLALGHAAHRHVNLTGSKPLLELRYC
jgi:hypothetical protein